MPLSPGTRLSAYEVKNPLGAGGMGEVYRARDTRLNRDVALKILPEAFTADPDRVARFEREAQALAALNHPNIAAIYGIEDADGVRALVMELVEGEDLAARLARGAVPADEALPIARQVADALAAAHDAGIVHRDLKPANIMVREDGTVKVLDFGLAKALGPDGQDTSATMAANSPTLTARATELGIIIGTAAYMAPEQARGKSVDRRADVWAFGVVLLELLTGRRAFEGPEVTDILAAVIKDTPPFEALPAHTAPPIRRLLQRCLQKDRAKRLDSMRVAQLEIDDAIAGGETTSTAAPAVQGGRTLGLFVVAAGAALGTALATWLFMRPGPEAPRPVAQVQVAIPQEQGLLRAIAVSDRHLAYTAGRDLYLRPLDGLDATPVARGGAFPFFSPDGEWLAYFINNEIRKVQVTSGTDLPIVASEGFRDGAWSREDQIVFIDGAGRLQIVPASGGTPRVLPEDDTDIGSPVFTPDGRAVVYLADSGPNERIPRLLRLDDGAIVPLAGIQTQQPVVILPDTLLFSRDGDLLAVPFSAGTGDMPGDPVTVLGNMGARAFALSPGGVLAYDPNEGNAQRTFVWVDASGKEEPTGIPPREYTYGRVSPDGSRAALDDRSGDNDIWVWSFGPRTEIRLTTEASSDEYPVWSRDGRRVIYAEAGAAGADGNESIASRAANGTGDVTRHRTGPNHQTPYAVSQDGQSVVFREDVEGRGTNLGLLTLADGESKMLLESRFNEQNADISANGRWMAYSADETGQQEVYVRPFPAVEDDKIPVSTGGAQYPVWSRDGRQLFFVSQRLDRLFSVAVTYGADGSISFGPPRELFDTTPYIFPNRGRNHDVAPDGRFLMLKPANQNAAAGSTITMWINWFGVLRERMAGR